MNSREQLKLLGLDDDEVSALSTGLVLLSTVSLDSLEAARTTIRRSIDFGPFIDPTAYRTFDPVIGARNLELIDAVIKVRNLLSDPRP
jgi:hypothetical protein